LEKYSMKCQKEDAIFLPEDAQSTSLFCTECVLIKAKQQLG